MAEVDQRANCLLELKELVAGYGKLAVLHGISLAVTKGTLVALIGPNGAGKTSLTKSIMHLTTIMKGEIWFSGQLISPKKANEITAMGIGYVPQRSNVFPGMTVEENLEMGAFLLPKGKMACERDRVYGIFPRLKERQKQKVSTLSGGERQMMAVGIALVLKPQLLILDEPTSGLAPQVVSELVQCIRNIKDKGSALLWVVEENPMEVLPFADQVYVMEGGTIKAQQTGSELLARPDFAQIFLGKTGI